jgi:ATP-dependent Lhr-like helicase
VSVQGRIRHRPLDRISPMAIGIVADIGRIHVDGDDLDLTLDELTRELVEEARVG